MNLAISVVFVYVVLMELLGWLYFRRYILRRPPIGVFNLWDITLMVGGVILVPYLYLALPRWLVATLLGLSLLGIVYFTFEPILPRRWMVWLVAIIFLTLDLGVAQRFGGQSSLFFAINNLLQLLAVIGVANLWAQSGLKARDAAVLGVALSIYDFLFTSVLPLMNALYARLAGLPFAPLVAWPIGFMERGGSFPNLWIGIGLGDLLLAVVFPLVMRKAYGWQAGITALLLALGALGGLLVMPVWGVQIRIFPVMVALGPLMVIQYLYWRRQRGAERTTWQYRQAEPTPGPV